MSVQSSHISESIEVLNKNLIQIAQVSEWADFMGYQNPKKFSRKFLRYYSIRPCKILASVRVKSIYKEIQSGVHSNFEIARHHGLPDEVALNKFVNYHIGCCPSKLKKMSKEQLSDRLEKIGGIYRQ